MDCSLPLSSIHGIFQARVLEWVAISFSRGSSQPRDQTQVSCIVGRRFTIWATREDMTCGWHHPYGRKWRTKEPLDESEREEWKSWLKAQHSENYDHGIRSCHFMASRWGNNRNSERLYCLGSKITADSDCIHEIKMLALWKKSYDQPRQHIKKQRYYFANKGLSSQSYGFSSSHVWMWELDSKESWVLCSLRQHIY